MADGVLGTPYGAPLTNYDAQALFDQVVAAQWPLPTAPTTYAPNDPIVGGAYSTTDNSSYIGRLSFRHNGRKAANFLFCDGHVETMQPGQTLNKNFLSDP